MKTETVTIQVQRFTDENGNATCCECIVKPDYDDCVWAICETPTAKCPLWHNAVKPSDDDLFAVLREAKPQWPTFEDWHKSITGDDGYNAKDAWEAARK